MAALAVAACGGPGETPDSGLETRDAGSDAARRRDADAGSDAAREDASTPEVGLTVLTLNLHCLETSGTAYATNEARVAAIAELADAEQVWAIALQEVCGDGATDALTLLRDALEGRTGQTWSASSAFAHVAWEGTEREADESVAVIAREAITSERVIDHRAQGALRRVTLFATLASGITIATVHLDHRDAIAREEQARELAAAGLVLGGIETIVAGDFNARVGTPPPGAMAAMGFIDASAELHADRIDHVFVHRGARWAAIGARAVLDTDADRVSDHPGILAQFARRDPPRIETTRIVVRADAGLGHHLFARGDRAPLAWDRGWPMTNVSAAEWQLVLSELDGPLTFKTLIDDSRWQLGEDLVVAPGGAIDFAPSYE